MRETALEISTLPVVYAYKKRKGGVRTATPGQPRAIRPCLCMENEDSDYMLCV